MIDYPLSFYIRKEIVQAGLPERLDADWTGLGSWDHALHMISLALLERGVPCKTTCEVPSSGVVIANPQSVGFDFRFPDDVCFICYQGDWGRCLWADAHIVINRHQLDGPNLTLADRLFGVGPLLHLPFIPEPSLIPRHPERRDRFENIAYFGTPYNLLPELRTPEWSKRLAEIGLNFIVEADVSKHADYSSIDCVVAIRPPDRSPAQKPPNKLWNAWRAGVPAILGPEPGFREQRISELDYLECNCAEDTFSALKRLQSNPGLATSMREHGIGRQNEFTVDSISRHWIESLQGPVRRIFMSKKSDSFTGALWTLKKIIRARLRGLRQGSRSSRIF